MLLPDPAAPAALNQAAAAALRDDKSGTVKIDGEDVFLHVHNSPLRLVVVGAVHIAQALVPFAERAGFAVTVVGPAPRLRNGRAVSERDSLDRMARRGDGRSEAGRTDGRRDPDPRSELDDPALDRALRSDAFYIGALGSRRTHAARLGRLRDLGHDDASLARIKGPVGLNIEAVTAPEIGISIVAELIAVRRGSPLAPVQAAKQAA